MAYCTLQQLKDRYSETLLIQLSDRADVATGTVDAALFARAIDDADALIDGYLKVRYALPLAHVPVLVTDLSLRISIYTAHAQVAAEKIRDDYREAMKILRDIASGAVKLDVAGTEPAGSGGAEVRTNEPDRRLSADSMTGYI